MKCVLLRNWMHCPANEALIACDVEVDLRFGPTLEAVTTDIP
jgi:hypothetical protein